MRIDMAGMGNYGQPKAPITREEYDSVRNSIYIGQEVECRVNSLAGPGGPDRIEKCTVEYIAPRLVVCRRKCGLSASVTYSELAVMAREKEEKMEKQREALQQKLMLPSEKEVAKA